MNKVIRTAALLIGIIFCINALIMPRTAVLSVHTFIAIFIGVVLICYALLSNRFHASGYFKAFKILLLIGLVIYALLMSLVLSGYRDTVTNREDAVIVLGAQVVGAYPSRPLKYRLDRAIQYAKDNREAIIVVSGGKGSDEQYAEAEVMANYLQNKGISKERILVEALSANTLENFTFSKKLLDQYFEEKPYKVCFISNSFHCFRAKGLAKKVGFGNITYAGAKLDPVYFLPQTARECLAIAYHFILGG